MNENDVIVRYSNKNLGNYIDDYYVEKINFCDIEPSIVVEKLNKAKLQEYIIYLKRYLGINEKNQEYDNILIGFEDLQIFRENISLWDTAISFIEYFPSVFKNFSCKKNLYSYLVAAIIIVHKYHIDDSYENNVVADYFSIDLKLLNKCEMKILLRFNHHLPFVEKDLFVCTQREYNKVNSNLNREYNHGKKKIAAKKKKLKNNDLNPARKAKVIKIKK